MKVAEWAKSYAALVGLLAAGALGVSGLPLAWKLPLALVVAGSGSFAVWKIPNADPPAPPAPAWAAAGPAWDEPISYLPTHYRDDYFFGDAS